MAKVWDDTTKPTNLKRRFGSSSSFATQSYYPWQNVNVCKTNALNYYTILVYEPTMTAAVVVTRAKMLEVALEESQNDER
jgi:hypothetical protein